MSQKISKIVCIIVMWGLLIYVGYNVLTVEATTEKKYNSYKEYTEIIEPICKEHDGKIEWGSGECMFKNDSREKAIVFEKELDDRGLGHDYTAEEEASWNQKAAATDIKEICKGFDSGKWNDDSNKCEFSKQGIKVEDDAEFDHVLSDEGLIDEYYEEVAAKEDAICDDEDADSTNVKLCMSDKREQQLNNIVKTCDKVDGKLNSKGECETDGSGDTPKADRFNEELMKLEEETGYPSIKEDEPIIEDWGNTVKTEEEQARDKVIKIVEESEEGNEVHGNAEIDYTTADETDSNDEEDERRGRIK